jgi:DNA-binding response OmpR family regulator
MNPDARGHLMVNVILISGDPATHKEITAALPKGASLEAFATPDELARRAAPAEDPASRNIILVDLSGPPTSSHGLESFRRAGTPWIALIGSAAQRESAFRDGFDDYLLRPVSASELSLRLDRLLSGSAASLARERQAAIGRLTSYFCHDVSNTLQTIRGAVDLALEEPNLSPDLTEYLTICRQETVNIGRKIERLRQIYRPKSVPPQPVALGALLHEVLGMASDETLRVGIAVREEFDPSLPQVKASSDPLCLAFLMMVFHICEEFGDLSGGELRVRTESGRGSVFVTFLPIPGTHPFSRSSGPVAAGQGAVSEPAALPPDLEPARELILAQRGELQALGRGRESPLQVRLPSGGD